MTCDEVRELLPEHLLGILDAEEDRALERHLRGCAACRKELARLEDGLAALAHATHDEEPPAELRERVLSALHEERELERGDRAGTTLNDRRRPPTVVLGVAAAVGLLLVLAAAAWGTSQARRADRLAVDAASYRNLLVTLGGEEFHLGTVTPAGGEEISGQVLLYQGDRAHGWSSWGVLFVQSPGRTASATATLLSEDGGSLELPELEFEDGEAAVWIVVPDDVSGYDRLTITDADGSLVATASISEA